jgi:RNA-directed DNA polymerase
LDHFVLRQIRPRAYCRYVDDFVLFHEDKTFLGEARTRIESQLELLRLRLHEGKSRIHRTAEGITFLGWRIFPDHRRLVRSNVVRFRRRIRILQDLYQRGELDWEEVDACLQAWNAHASHGDTWKLRERIFSQSPFCGG